MPKWSGPTCWTRGWSTPRGLPTVATVRRGPGRRRVREVAMRGASQQMDGLIPLLQLTVRSGYASLKPTYQGLDRQFAAYCTKRIEELSRGERQLAEGQRLEFLQAALGRLRLPEA